MTREDALNPMDYFNGKDCFFIDCKNMKSKKELNKLINKIYDDFESRTCSSCIHGDYENDTFNGCLLFAFEKKPCKWEAKNKGVDNVC